MRRSKLSTITIVMNLTIMLFGHAARSWWWSVTRKESVLTFTIGDASPTSPTKIAFQDADSWSICTMRNSQKIDAAASCTAARRSIVLYTVARHVRRRGHGSWCFWRRVNCYTRPWNMIRRMLWITVVSSNTQTPLREPTTFQHLTASACAEQLAQRGKPGWPEVRRAGQVIHP